MEKNSYQTVAQHVPILGWLYIVTHAFFLLIAGVVFLTVVGGGLISGDAEAIAITSLVGTIVSTILVVVSAPGIVAGIGLLKRKRWARLLALLLAILNLFNFPIGTAVGVYTLWVLFQNDAPAYFEGPQLA